MSEIANVKNAVAKLKNLPPLPESSVRIISAVNNPDISVEELVDVVSQSPVLVARLLGLANSAYFGRKGQISDLRIAIIQVLGLNLVKSLALSIALNVELDTSKCKSFDADFFWSHTLTTSLLAQKLAININDDLITPGTVYTSGLLLNIGLLVAVFLFPVEMNEVFLQSKQRAGSVSDKILEVLGQTQYELGAVLLENWQLPEHYQIVVREFRQNNDLGEEQQLITLLELSHWVALNIATDNELIVADYANLLDKLSLSASQLDDVVTNLLEDKEKINELARVFGG